MAGSSQHWHSRMRRRGVRRRQRERKRTRPEGKRFSWPVTPVPGLLSSLNSTPAGVMTAFLGWFAASFTCSDSLISCYSQKWESETT